MTKRRGRKPRGYHGEQEIYFAVLRARFPTGVMSRHGSNEAYRLSGGSRVAPSTNLTGAFIAVEDDLRRRGIIKVRQSEGLAERGSAVRRAYYRAERALKARDARYLKLLKEEFNRRGRRWRSGKRMSKEDAEIAFAAHARLNDEMK